MRSWRPRHHTSYLSCRQYVECLLAHALAPCFLVRTGWYKRLAHQCTHDCYIRANLDNDRHCRCHQDDSVFHAFDSHSAYVAIKGHTRQKEALGKANPETFCCRRNSRSGVCRHRDETVHYTYVNHEVELRANILPQLIPPMLFNARMIYTCQDFLAV
jgi:hypothetical protein